MQSEKDQRRAEKHQRRVNNLRRRAYQAKLSPDQQRRSKIAAAVDAYCKLFNLTILQSASAIRIALAQLDLSDNDQQAYNTGTSAARIIALTSANIRIRSIQPLRTVH